MRTATRIGAVSIGALLLGTLSGCDSRPQQSARDVKTAFAVRARDNEIPFGTSGTLKAGRIDLKTLQLLDVRFDNGDALLMHAERAEIIVSVEKDTMMLRFFNVLAVMPESEDGAGDGMIREEAVLASSPWKLDIDVVAEAR